MRASAASVSVVLSLSAINAVAAPLSLGPTGHLVTTVEINGGRAVDFVVDTAASASAAYPTLIKSAGLAPIAGSGGQVHGASGHATVDLFQIETLKIDERVHRGLAVAGLPESNRMPQAAGILGADVLSRYLVDFDLPAGALRMRDPGASPALPGRWVSVPFTLNWARFPVLEGQLDGKSIGILLDTGARRTIVNAAAAQVLGIDRTSAAVRPTDPIHGATLHATDAVTATFGTLQVGDWTAAAGTLTIADLPVFRVLGEKDRPFMILGMDKLKERRFIIDYANQRLLVQLAPAA